MIFVDRLLASGIRFVFDKVLVAAEAELDDAARLKEELLEAQMKLESGEIDEETFAEIESDVFVRLREIRERERTDAPAGRMEIAGIEVSANVSYDEGP